ncbi:MAG TPA: DNA polymerase III subunit gamma/tau, partial [Candidatus Dormibacteraeota bacterium]|nr:DNA polymerase III subunit gamma/tau [Candidatus Dormibacteraeota bacterium]
MTALYSVYRSQRFEDLVGQETAARTLKNALVSGRVAHAYLFTGIRGTGKTSTARILAKAVNCLNPKDGEPCNECTSCVAITEGSATDLIEIDAASNRGVDEIRDLREKAKYLPAQLKHKVYIIDEAHQLTPEAFNALLKTLEEPPEHVLFILCTTEAHKLPSTIISRCQRFDFRRIGEADIAGRLQQIVTGEGLVAADDGLALIATMAHGSMRDAITMLDQMASAGAASIDAEAVRQHLGLVSAPELAALLAGAARGDAAFVLREIEGQAQRGADLRQLANGLAEMARKAVLISLGAADAAALGLDPASGADLTAAVGAAGREFAAAAFEAALAASTEMKQTHDPRLLLELLLLRLASGRDEGPPSPQPAGVGAGAPAAAGSGASERVGTARASQTKAGGDTATSRGKPASAGEDEQAGEVDGQTDAVAAGAAGEAGVVAAGLAAKADEIAASVSPLRPGVPSGSPDADGAGSVAPAVDPPAGDVEVADSGPAGMAATPPGPPIAPELLEDIVREWPRLFEAF